MILFALSAALILGQPSASSQPAALGVVMGKEPLRLDDIGLTLFLPEGSRVEPGKSITVAAQVTAPDDLWFLNIQTPRANSSTLTPTEFADRIIEEIRTRHGVVHSEVRKGSDERVETIKHSDAELLPGRISNLVIDGLPADRFYMLVPDGVGDERVLRGYTVVRSSPSQFVVFEFMSAMVNWDINQHIYETIVAGADFVDPIALEAARGRAVMRGAAVLREFSLSDYEKAVEKNSDRWERLFTPASTGSDMDATEHGYRRIRAWKGPRGSMKDGLSPSKYSPAEREDGFIVAVDSRLLQPDGSTIDAASRYFMSLDGAREAWTILMTARGLPGSGPTRPPPTYAETGARDGDSMQIAIMAPGEPASEVRPIIKGGGYISQVQAFLIQNLLLAEEIADEFGFYAYQSSERQINLRRVTLDHPPEAPSQWRIAMTLREHEPPQVSIFGADGTFIRTLLPDGKMWAPTTVQRLGELWRYKGLPMD